MRDLAIDIIRVTSEDRSRLPGDGGCLETGVELKLLSEAANGVPAHESCVPSSPAVDDLRARLEREVAEIRARGDAIEIPVEFPHLPEAC